MKYKTEKFSEVNVARYIPIPQISEVQYLTKLLTVNPHCISNEIQAENPRPLLRETANVFNKEQKQLSEQTNMQKTKLNLKKQESKFGPPLI